MESDMKKSQICPIWGQSDSILDQIYHLWDEFLTLSLYSKTISTHFPAIISRFCLVSELNKLKHTFFTSLIYEMFICTTGLACNYFIYKAETNDGSDEILMKINACTGVSTIEWIHPHYHRDNHNLDAVEMLAPECERPGTQILRIFEECDHATIPKGETRDDILGHIGTKWDISVLISFFSIYFHSFLGLIW